MIDFTINTGQAIYRVSFRVMSRDLVPYEALTTNKFGKLIAGQGDTLQEALDCLVARIKKEETNG